MPVTESATAIWRYHNPVCILFGKGVLARLLERIPEGRVLLVTTAGFTRRGATAQLAAQLGKDRVIVYDQVTPNPELHDLDAITDELRSVRPGSVVALGGGSALDTGKILGVTLAKDEEQQLHKVFRQGYPQSWTQRLPVIAVPTTSGTGAEVTPFATVWDSVVHKKYSVAGDNLYPTHALLDPSLTWTLPPDQTLFTGLDAISHALESLWNKNRTPVSEVFAFRALELALDALPVVLEAPDNLERRARMQQASLLAGWAISQTRTALAHSISYPLTSRYGVPHGLACSFTLTGILREQRTRQWTLWENNAQLFDNIWQMLDSLGLSAKIGAYASPETIRSLVTEMSDPARADNFNLEATGSFILSILEQALG